MDNLPSDLQKKIGGFFNWNTVLIRKVEHEFELCCLMMEGYKENLDTQNDFRSLQWSLEWWLHLLKTEGRTNWRLKNSGEKLLEQMEDMNLNTLVDAFAELLEYNRNLFQKPPVL